MKRFLQKTLFVIMLVFPVFAFSQKTYILQADFSDITSGNSTSSTGANSVWSGNTKFPTVDRAYQAGGMVKLGTSSLPGSITSQSLDLSANGGSFKIDIKVKGWTSVEGTILVTVSGKTAQTITYAATMASNTETKTLVFSNGVANSTIKIETSAKRAYIDEVEVYYEAVPNSPIVNGDAVAFGNQNINTVSTGKPLELTYGNLTTADLSLITTAPFSISKTSNGTYGTSLIYTNAERTSPTTLYVKYAPTAAGAANGTIEITGGGLSAAKSIALTGNGIDPNVTAFNFENCAPANSTSLSDGFMQYSSIGAQTWACTTFGRDASDATGKASLGNAVQINGYAGSNNANRDWLISPAFDLSTMNYPLLSFWSRTAFNGDVLQLKYSTNYTGNGNPEAATWVDIDGKFPLASSDTWTKSQNIDLSNVKTANVYIAFVYTSSTTSGARWTIDDFEITNSSTPAPTELNLPLNSLNFGYQTVGTPSAEKTFIFSASSISSDVTLSAPANFIISKTSGGTFTTNLTYTAAEANNMATTVYTKFTPTLINTNYNQNLTISTTGVASQNLNLTGNTFNTNSTLEVVNWNIEWFGASGNGPTDKTQQAANVKTIFNNLNADIYGLQEVVDTALFRNNVLPAGYNVIFSDFGSYADHKNHSGYATAQKLAFMYRTDIVKPVATYGILRDTYYPGNLTNSDTGSPYKNWSSGRFPFLMEAKVNINNVEETIYFIDLHAKANTGDVAAQNDSYDRRKGGALQLKQWIDANLADKKVIILGDFNDVLNPDKTIAPKPAGTGTSYSDFTLDNTNYFPVTLPLSLAGKRSTAGFPTVIDNVIVNKDLNDIYLENSAEVLDNVTQIVTSYSSTTTDHYPVQTRYFFKETVLPVKFDEFTAKQEGAAVIVKWSTASESNNKQFIVERSNDGKTFEKVREVSSKGNSNQKNTYSIIDNNAKQGVNYYKLSQTDLDGKTTSFPKLSVVSLLEHKTSSVVYPNPVKDKVSINYVSSSSDIELSVVSNDGRLIFKSKGNIKLLEAQLNSRIGSMPNGLYIISLTENGASHREKLVKQ